MPSPSMSTRESCRDRLGDLGRIVVVSFRQGQSFVVGLDGEEGASKIQETKLEEFSGHCFN
jgi:hypothetical protein